MMKLTAQVVYGKGLNTLGDQNTRPDVIFVSIFHFFNQARTVKKLGYSNMKRGKFECWNSILCPKVGWGY
jgi:hypothetical protein